MKYNETLTWKEINETPEIFGKIIAENSEVMAELVNAIKESSATNFVAAGRGSSNNALVYFKYLLEVMSNYTVGFSAPSILTLYKGKTSYANSIIIGCSSSGMAEDVLEVIKKGNEDGAITIAVTNDKTSPIAKCAKYHLYCTAGEENSFVATKSFNSQLFLLLWLASELSGKKENISILKRLKLDIEYVLPQIKEYTDEYASLLSSKKEGFVVARGLTYPIALETSLMLKETCKINVGGYAGSEIFHGPIAMVNENTPVMIFCAEFAGDEEIQSIIRADQIKYVQRILNLNAPVILVTNDAMLTGRFKKCNDVLLNFNLPEAFSIFVFSIFSQMLACKLSCLNGFNPDKIDNLQKTTITK